MSTADVAMLINEPTGARSTPSAWRTGAWREMLGALIARELKGRYKGSAVGFLWAVLVPLFMAAVYVMFLRILAGQRMGIGRVLVGVFAWQYTAQCLQGGMVSVTSNANLVKKVLFPRLLLPTATVAAQLVHYGVSLAVQIVLLTALDAVAWSPRGWLALPAVIAGLTALNLGLALLLSAAHVHLRDTQHLVGVLLSAWFFVSPVMYDLDFARAFLESRPNLAPWIWLNPLTSLLTALRACLLSDVSYPWTPLSAAALGWPVVVLAVGLAVFQRAQRHFADLL
ncbi:MAG: ABC transporter permease [Kiritimatiellae bacterium]|nr:ABC transporter permease [Kiritimatiellia bacterium]